MKINFTSLNTLAPEVTFQCITFIFLYKYSINTNIMLQKPVLEKPSTTLGVGELRFITPAGKALSPRQRGYRVFIHGQAWLSGFVGLQELGDCKEQDKGKWDKLQFLVLSGPVFWDLHDPDFARSKLSYRGRRSKRLCKIFTFPLQL